MPLIRAIKALLVACIGAFGVLVAYDNVIDYGSNWAFVQHVLSMDTVFPDNALRASRAITDPGIQRIAYWAIIGTEAVFGLLCLAGAWRLYRARHDGRAFVAAKPLAVAGLALMFVLYFADAPTLVKELATFEAPLLAYVWIGILTFTTYTLAGHMREQVCLYMCPWPRIQAALTDEHALNVTYRHDRGEPRGSVKKSAALRAQGMPAGDCVDCYQCVYVCPTGVDIRNGPNLGCIQCGLCIDACDAVMAKIDRPARLIAYDTDLNIKRRQEGQPELYHIVRMRTVFYAGVIAIVAAVMAYALATRQSEGISVIHDRNPIFVRLSDGELRNGFTVRILNKSLERRSFVLTVEGLADIDLKIVGDTVTSGPMAVITVGPDQSHELRVLVSTYSSLPPAASIPLTFRITDAQTGQRASAVDHFRGP